MNIQDLIEYIENNLDEYSELNKLDNLSEFLNGFIGGAHFIRESGIKKDKFWQNFDIWARRHIEKEYKLQIDNSENYVHHIEKIAKNKSEQFKMFAELCHIFIEEQADGHREVFLEKFLPIIEKRPGMLVGEGELADFYLYLRGFNIGVYEGTDFDVKNEAFMYKFHGWVKHTIAREYNVIFEEERNYVYYIESVITSEEERLNTFFNMAHVYFEHLNSNEKISEKNITKEQHKE